MGRRDKPLSSSTTPSIGVLLRHARQEKNISLTKMAELLQYSKSYLSGAENDSRPASQELIRSYELQLGLTLGTLNTQFSLQSADNFVSLPQQSLLVYWSIPYQRNPFFTGREEVLTHLRALFEQGKSASIHIRSLSGLGGIGKTQIAIEYAYYYHDKYRAVFWIRADTYEVIVADFVSLASVLGLLESEESDHIRSVSAVQQWLKEHDDWLLIFDNVESVDMVKDFIPVTARNGHVLFTTRIYTMGAIAQVIPIEKMEPILGATFLLRRASIIPAECTLNYASKADRVAAQTISELVGGLPLALDQVGAYVEETKCGLSRYLNLYQTRSTTLLRRRGTSAFDHPESVTTTLSLSIDKVQHVNIAAVELLHFCAFLYHSAIPEEIIDSNLGPILQPIAIDPIALDEVIGVLITYSLLSRDSSTRTLAIHPLVQATVKNDMSEEIRHLWVERVVHVMSRLFPTVSAAKLYQLQRYLPQALTCTELIQREDIVSLEAARLLNEVGYYLIDQARYTEAEVLLQDAFKQRERYLGIEDVDTILSLGNLIRAYRSQGKYEQAQPLLEQFLILAERLQDSESLETSDCMDDLARHYYSRAQYFLAEEMYLKALSIREKELGTEHPKIAETIIHLAVLYHAQNLYEQAEPLYQRALAINEKVFGAEDQRTALSLDNLARLYHAQRRYDQLEYLYQRALTIREKILGPEHPDTAISLDSLALLYHDQGKYEQAESFYLQSLAIREKVRGSGHSDIAVSLDGLAALYRTLKRYEEVEILYKRALAIRENTLGSEHRYTLMSFANLASFYYTQGKYEIALPLYERLLPLYEQNSKLGNPLLFTLKQEYKDILRQTKSS